jgi:hypothetical protein
MRHTPEPQSAVPSAAPAPADRNSRLEQPPVPTSDVLRLGKTTWQAWLARSGVIAGGAVATAIPTGAGLARTIEGRPGALPLLALAAIVAIVTVVASAVVVMYQARQETLRKEIEYRSADTFAGALARCIDDAHAKARNLPAARELEETARVRASARELLSDMTPHVVALLKRDPGDAAVRPSVGHEAFGQPGQMPAIVQDASVDRRDDQKLSREGHRREA